MTGDSKEVKIGAVTHLKKVTQEDYILGCIPNRCAEEACLACQHDELVLLAGKSGLNWLRQIAKSLLSDPQ